MRILKCTECRLVRNGENYEKKDVTSEEEGMGEASS